MMHVLRLAVVVCVTGTAPALANPPEDLPVAAKKELKVLEGKWRVVKFQYSDHETTPDGDEVVVEFKGGAIDFAKSAAGAVVMLDPGTDPKCLDFKVSVGSGVFKKDTTYESVYKLDGDTLSWAVHIGREGKNRPSAFDKPKNSEVMVMVLNLAKE
jgi:uncharacterized protein (TIGR03067 family)